MQFLLFVAAILWSACAQVLAENAASGFSRTLDLGDYEPLAASLFLLFLIVCGFAFLRRMERRLAPLAIVLGLPRRSTSREEWSKGALIGWAIALASILPVALTRGLNVQLWNAPRAYELLAISLLTLAVSTLAHTLGVFGYGLQRITEATGPVRATALLMILAAGRTWLLSMPGDDARGVRVIVAALSALLLCICWFRTHGLWLGWGLHFAWAAATGVLFGLPLVGDSTFSSIVDARANGPVWLTGGSFGPAAAAWSVVLLLAAIPIVVRVTSDYAWDYTRSPIIPAGYDVTIPPPAAHVALEQAAAPVNTAPLVQILPATPGNRTESPQ